jgi:hypothetical protein
MSVSTDLRAYAESARDQGTALLEKITAAANGAVGGLRDQAGKALGAVTSDERVAALVDRAGTVARPVVSPVVNLVQERVVQPVRTLAAPSATAVVEAPPAPAPTKATAGARKPAATRARKAPETTA